MSMRSVLLLFVALAIAGGTAFLARNWLASERAAIVATVPKQEGVVLTETQVLVAAQDIPAGSFVKSENLAWQPWPKEGANEAYAIKGKKDIKDFAGTVARTRIVVGQPLTDKLLVHPGDRGFLAAVLEPGRRAVSVPINATSGISGFVFPGDKVDVIVTGNYETGSAQNKRKRSFSQTILESVRILAIDQKTEVVDGKADVAKTATLEVTPKQAEKVSLGLEVGTLSLSLRSLATDDEKGQDETKAAALASGEDKPDPGKETRSYTLDTQVFTALTLGGGSGGSVVNVMRGGDSSAISTR